MKPMSYLEMLEKCKEHFILLSRLAKAGPNVVKQNGKKISRLNAIALEADVANLEIIKFINECDEWQPIETAPLDKTPILAFCADGQIASVEYWNLKALLQVNQGFKAGDEYWSYTSEDICCEPILWQPLNDETIKKIKDLQNV